MKGTKPYWYPATACSILPFFICLHFPNLVTKIILEYVISHQIDKNSAFFLDVLVFTIRSVDSKIESLYLYSTVYP